NLAAGGVVHIHHRHIATDGSRDNVGIDVGRAGRSIDDQVAGQREDAVEIDDVAGFSTGLDGEVRVVVGVVAAGDGDGVRSGDRGGVQDNRGVVPEVDPFDGRAAGSTCDHQ